MQHNLGLSITTTTAGMVGGVSKAVSEHLTLASISLTAMVDVAFYALISASVGYGVKLAFDGLRQRWMAKNRKR